MKNESIGAQIAYWRKKRKLTQSELAKKVGVASKTVISGIENDIRAPSTRMLQKIAEALNCQVSILLSDKK